MVFNPLGMRHFWKVTEAEPNDVDGVVNANALFYLGPGDKTNQIVEYLISIIKQNKEDACDKWHLSPFNFYYALSRNFLRSVKSLDVVRAILWKESTRK